MMQHPIVPYVRFSEQELCIEKTRVHRQAACKVDTREKVTAERNKTDTTTAEEAQTCQQRIHQAHKPMPEEGVESKD